MRVASHIADARPTGPHPVGGEAENPAELDARGGLAPDFITPGLASLSATLEDLHRASVSAQLRAIASEKQNQGIAATTAGGIATELKRLESQVSYRLKKELTKHPLYPWLSQFPGLAGPTTARLLAVIADPHKFPGLICEAGHYLPDTYGGEECPIECRSDDDKQDGRCLAPVHPRHGSGVRSLRHYLGLHVVNGKSPRKTRGQQGDWNVRGRTLILQPDGIADQIVKQRVPVYREIYDQTKERLQRERGAERTTGDEPSPGLSLASSGEAVSGNEDGCTGGLTGTTLDGSEVGKGAEIGTAIGLRPFQIDAIAKKVAAKRFVGDLLIAWKQL